MSWCGQKRKFVVDDRTEFFQMSQPVVSVVMPVYNRERYVGAAIQSILDQTFTDFEFIIVDDGSSDGSVDVIQNFDDPRIRLIILGENRGIGVARNTGNNAARGEYIAVMDSDDIALPQRLEKQVAYMRAHPDVGVCGASIRYVDEGFKPIGVWRADVENGICRAKLFFGLPFAHPTFMVKSDIYRRVSYPTQFEVVKDYAFLVQASASTRLGAVKDVLLLMREHGGRISNTQSDRQMEYAMRVRSEVLGNMGLTLDKQGQDIWRKLQLAYPVALEPQELQAISDLGARILEADRQSAYTSQPALHSVFARRWWSICRRSVNLGKPMFDIYRRSPIKWQGPLSTLYEARLWSLYMGMGRKLRMPQWF